MLEMVEEALERGMRVPGGYRLDRILGEGGMGVVWVADHEPTGRSVALKFLRHGRADDAVALERFAREARAVMEIVHPNVVRVEAVLETDSGVPFLVMEHLEGESLRKRLVRGGPLEASECAELLLPVIAGVQAAHARGLVHRDLKPENVFLTTGGEVKVLDFGIAKRMDGGTSSGDDSASLTSTGALVGTPFYMAPEQVFGDDDIDERVDVWALGIVIYECVAGRRPTDATGFGQVLKRITTEPLEAVQIAKPGLSRELSTLVGRMLARPRDERPTLEHVRLTLARVAMGPTAPTMSERTPVLAKASLEPATTDGVARTASIPASAAAPTSRGLAIATALFALALFGGSVVFAWARTRPRKAPVVAVAAPNDREAAANVALRGTAEGARRDGAACLRDMNEHDRLDPQPELLTTNPASPWAPSRSLCMMLEGDCKGGHDLHLGWLKAQNDSRPADNLELQLDAVIGSYCQGPNLTPRERLLVASQRLSEAGGGLRTATAVECMEWYETEKSLVPLVAPRSLEDRFVTNAPLQMTGDVVACLARAADCDGSFRELVKARKATMPSGADPKSYEEETKLSYRMAVYLTPCRDKH